MDQIYTRAVAQFRQLFEIDDDVMRQAALNDFFEGVHPEKRSGLARGLSVTLAEDLKQMPVEKSAQFTTALKAWAALAPDSQP